jgi:hypothetical protein
MLKFLREHEVAAAFKAALAKDRLDKPGTPFIPHVFPHPPHVIP